MPHQIHHIPAGDGTELSALDATHTVKIAASDTDGLYELFEIDIPRGHAVPLHRHAWLECYYVLGGRITARIDDETFPLAPGSALTVPPHAAHTISSVTPWAKVLVFTVSDAMGRFFADLHDRVPTDQPFEQVLPLVLDVTRRHGVTFVDEPALA